MFLVVGINSKSCMREEVIQISDSVKLEKTKAKQKAQAFKLASEKCSEPKLVSYAFFQPK